MFYSPAPTFPIVPRSPLGLNQRPKIVELFEQAREPKTWAERVGIFKKEKPLHERHQMLQNLAESYPNYNAFLVGDKSQVQFSRLPYRSYNFGLFDSIKGMIAGSSQNKAQTPAPDLSHGAHNYGKWKYNRDTGYITYGCEGATDSNGRQLGGGNLSPQQQREIISNSRGKIDATDYGRIVNQHLTNTYGKIQAYNEQTAPKLTKDKSVFKEQTVTPITTRYQGRTSVAQTPTATPMNMSEKCGLSECNKGGFVNFALFQSTVLTKMNRAPSTDLFKQKDMTPPSNPLDAEIQKVSQEIKDQRGKIAKLTGDWHQADETKKPTLKVQIEEGKKKLADLNGRMADARMQKAKAAEMKTGVSTVLTSEHIPHSAKDVYLYSQFFSHLRDRS